jgi:hypothetical protein
LRRRVADAKEAVAFDAQPAHGSDRVIVESKVASVTYPVLRLAIAVKPASDLQHTSGRT